VKQTTPDDFFLRQGRWERVGELGIGDGTVSDIGLGKDGDGPETPAIAIKDMAIKDIAIGRRRKIMAVDADRRHGRSLSPGIPREALRSVGFG
jgi:hypothetical protein